MPAPTGGPAAGDALIVPAISPLVMERRRARRQRRRRRVVSSFTLLSVLGLVLGCQPRGGSAQESSGHSSDGGGGGEDTPSYDGGGGDGGSFYGFYGQDLLGVMDSPPTSSGLADLASDDPAPAHVSDPEGGKVDRQPRGGQIGPYTDAECDSMYGLCDSFYGFHGLNPNATNSSASSSTLESGSTNGAGSDGVSAPPSYSHCSETPAGCYPNNWTSVWVHDAPRVRHPIGSAAGAMSSRNVWSATLHDPRSLPSDVAPGHSVRDPKRPHGAVPAPSLLKLYPRSGPHEGGTNVTVHGGGFVRTGRQVCRFGGGPLGGEVHTAPATIVSATKLYCEAPRRRSPGVAVVTVRQTVSDVTGLDSTRMTIIAHGRCHF